VFLLTSNVVKWRESAMLSQLKRSVFLVNVLTFTI
jgi:hypothetical protein